MFFPNQNLETPQIISPKEITDLKIFFKKEKNNFERNIKETVDKEQMYFNTSNPDDVKQYFETVHKGKKALDFSCGYDSSGPVISKIFEDARSLCKIFKAIHIAPNLKEALELKKVLDLKKTLDLNEVINLNICLHYRNIYIRYIDNDVVSKVAIDRGKYFIGPVEYMKILQNFYKYCKKAEMKCKKNGKKTDKEYDEEYDEKYLPEINIACCIVRWYMYEILSKMNVFHAEEKKMETIMRMGYLNSTIDKWLDDNDL